MTTKRTDSPTSDAQGRANRRNAHLSTGPTTQSGKAKAAANSLLTGLYATQATAISRGALAEDPAEVEAFVEGCVADLGAETMIQGLAARQVAIALLRVLRFEANEAVQLGEAGRISQTLEELHPGIGTDAHLRSQIATLGEFQEFALADGEYDLVGPDRDLLRDLLPLAPNATRPVAARPSHETDSNSYAMSLEAFLVARVGSVWLGDWIAAANWAQVTAINIQHTLDSIEGLGAQAAAARTTDIALDKHTKLLARLEASLDRALARYRQLMASNSTRNNGADQP